MSPAPNPAISPSANLSWASNWAKHWGTSAGLVPFSTQNYEFSVPYNLVGSTVQIANSYYQGHGSVNKAYWANSYEFFHHLSLGVEAGYIFGQLNQNNIIQSSANGATLVSSTNDLNLNNLYFTYGMQLYGNLGKKWKYTLGATYSMKASLLAASTKLVLNNDSATLQNIQNNEGYLNLPNAYGAGLAITYKDKYTFLADYRYQNWNGVATTNDQEYPGQGYSIVSAERGSVGFEVSKKKTFYNTRIELSYLQAGLYYGNTTCRSMANRSKTWALLPASAPIPSSPRWLMISSSSMGSKGRLPTT
jgi:hypothetical protein